jgi:two-component system CheB/CheR fusion protein
MGLGSSAGGLEALRALVRNLPTGADVSYIIVQHMAPHFRSMLAEIIGRETRLTVTDIEDGVVPLIDHIYITPPNRNVIAENGTLRLLVPENDRTSPNPSADVFFGSLAHEKRGRAIAMVLSGTGKDGAKGIKAVHQAGGVTLAQDIHTAKYTSMPAAAIDTDCVNLIVSPEEAGLKIISIIENSHDLSKLSTEPIEGEEETQLVTLLLKQTGVDFRYYKTATFHRRVERRMAAVGANNSEHYLKIAKSSRSEVELLFKDLLISVTSFFRDPEEFMSIKDHLEKLVAAKNGEPIRIWVAGCATGEEAYSLAILFAEALGGLAKLEKAKIQIFATDIDTDALEIARRGFYPDSAFDEVRAEILGRYFDRSVAGYTVKRILRDKITFSNHNIAKDPPFMRMDLISCRNLLIYFQAPLKEAVFSNFHYSLVPNGLLFLGRSETVLGSDEYFRPVANEKHIFKQRTSIKPKLFVAPRVPTDRPVAVSTPREKTKEQLELQVANARFESLVTCLGDCAFLINSDMKLLRVYGDTRHYVALSEGEIDITAMSLLREPYRHDVRVAVPSSIRNRKPTLGNARRSQENPEFLERLQVYPVFDSPDSEVLAVAVFTRWQEDVPTTTIEHSSDEASKLISDLSHELRIAELNLQQFSEELETSNEELQSLNEELQSSNEELQSTNEELETSNEELQSTNEELSTVNEELHVSAQQLQTSNRSLNSILENIGIPLVVFDQNLLITHISAASEGVFDLPSGVALPHAGSCRVPKGFPNLVTVLEASIFDGYRRDYDIVDNEQSAILRVVPHLSASGEVVGAVVLLTDNTEALRKTQNQIELIFNRFPMGIMVRDSEGVIVRANDLAKQHTQLGSKLEDGTKLYEQLEPALAKQLVEADKKALSAEGRQVGWQSRMHDRDGSETIINTSIFRGVHPDKDEQALFSLSEDVTHLRRMEVESALTQNRLEQVVQVSGIGMWDGNLRTGEVYCSPRFLEIFAAPSNHVLTEKEITEAIHPDDRAKVRRAYQDHLKTRTPYHQNYRIVLPDGSIRWIDSQGQASWDEKGKAIQFVAVVQDATRERERENRLTSALQELSRSNEELNRFSYVCSHDMKEPVRMIEAMAGLLVNQELQLAPEKQAELLQRISNNTIRLGAIIDSLLAYSRIEAKIEMSEVDLNRVLADILEGLTLAIKEKNAVVKIGKMPTIHGAPVHFNQLFQNLIGNALKFSDKQEPLINVSCKTTKSTHCILVEDNGPGIPEASRDDVFALFRRLHRRDEVEGTGLGLSIAQRVVQQYGGTIRCIDGKLDGAAFEIKIPRKEPENG